MEALLFRFLGLGAILLALFAWHKSEVRDAVERINLQAQQERREAVAEYVVDMSARVTALQAKLATAQGEVRTEVRTVIERIPSYVTSNADAACRVPIGFVQSHDAAWGMPGVPLPVVGLVEADSGIPLSRVSRTNAENAGTCREIRAELEAAREWYRNEAQKRADFDKRITGR